MRLKQRTFSVEELGDRLNEVHTKFRAASCTQSQFQTRNKEYWLTIRARTIESFSIPVPIDSNLYTSLGHVTLDSTAAFRALPGFMSTLKWLKGIKQSVSVPEHRQQTPWLSANVGLLVPSPDHNRRDMTSAGVSLRPPGSVSPADLYDIDFIAHNGLDHRPIIGNSSNFVRAMEQRFEAMRPILHDFCKSQHTQAPIVDFLCVSRNPHATLAARRAGWHSLLALGHQFHGYAQL